MGLVAIWFMPGALFALILAICEVDLLWQVLAFLVTTVAALILYKKLIRPFFKPQQTNAQALIGQEAIITEDVDNLQGCGAAKVGGLIWSVRAQKEEALLVGDVVIVADIQGNKLICYKK